MVEWRDIVICKKGLQKSNRVGEKGRPLSEDSVEEGRALQA